MKANKFLLFLFISFVVITFSCNTGLERREDSLINKWEMTGFFQSAQEQSKRFNPNNDRWIQFFEDGTYKADGGPFPPTSGKYTLEDNLLHLISNEGPSENVSWNIDIKKDKMIFKQVPSKNTRNTEIHYKIQ